MPLFFAFTALALTLFSYHSAEADLLRAWSSDEYSHGLLIPLLSFFIAWHCLTRERPAIKPSWWGIWVWMAGNALHLLGILAAFEKAADYGLIVALIGLSLAFLGVAATRAIAPALIYLFFAVPVPHVFYLSLSAALQLLSSTMGVAILEAMRIPVFQEGNIIDLGGYKLQVAEACSGLRYLFPLMSFGFLVAYLLDDRWWKRAFIFLSTIPIAIGMNALRIGVIGVTVDAWGIAMAEGFIHAFEGWIIFLICTLILLAEVLILLPAGARGRFRFEYLGPSHGPLATGRLPFAPPVAAVFILSIAAALFFGAGILDQRKEPLPPHSSLMLFPLAIDAWHGQPVSLDSNSLRELQLTDYWLADYRKPGEAAPVNLYIAYYANQRVGSALHSPDNCIPGSGWLMQSREDKTARLANGKPFAFSETLISKMGANELVYFWFAEHGHTTTDIVAAKWNLFMDALAMRPTDGALIRLVTPLAAGESKAAAEVRLNKFLSVSYPIIATFLPHAAQHSLPSTDTP